VAPSALMPTTGRLRWRPPIDPWKAASPKAKIPPSLATSQYPRPSAVGARSTTGASRRRPPIDPKNRASPKVKMPPSAATSQ